MLATAFSVPKQEDRTLIFRFKRQNLISAFMLLNYEPRHQSSMWQFRPRALDTQHGISSGRLFLRIRNESSRLQDQKSLMWSVDAVIRQLKGPMVDRNAIFGTENFVGSNPIRN
jgi:hypothetical protein